VGAGERGGGQVQQAARVAEGHAAALGPGVEVPAHDGQEGAHPFGFGLDHGQRGLRLAADHGGRSGAEDAGLFGGDLLEGVAQEFAMVEVDRGR
jgi:CTP:molybdopterin cytidylyltransferase MocA